MVALLWCPARWAGAGWDRPVRRHDWADHHAAWKAMTASGVMSDVEARVRVRRRGGVRTYAQVAHMRSWAVAHVRSWAVVP
jgi:hypothetical protein